MGDVGLKLFGFDVIISEEVPPDTFILARNAAFNITENAIGRIARDAAHARERAVQEYMAKHGCTIDQMHLREEMHGNVVKWHIGHVPAESNKGGA